MAGHLQKVPHHAAQLHDALPTHALDLSTPEDTLNDNKLDVVRLRAFSCEAFMHTPGNVCGRHDTCSLTGSTSLYCLSHRPSCIIESRNVVLNEGGPTHHHKFILDHDSAPAAPAMPNGDGTSAMPDGDGTLATPYTPSLAPANSITASHPRRTTHVPIRPHHMVSPYDARRTARTPISNDDPRYTVSPHGSLQTDCATAHTAHTADPENPQSNKGAMARPVKQLAVRKLRKRIILDHKLNMAFRIKGGPEGVTLKYNARVITQGFTQIEGGIDEPFALVTKLPPLHAALFPAAKSNFKAHKMDVKVAYPNITKGKPYQQQSRTPQHVERSTHRCNPRHSRNTSQHLGPINVPINAPSTQSSTPHSGLTPTLAHTITTFDRHAANASIKCARHSTARFTPASLHRQGATGGPTPLGHMDASWSSDTWPCLQCLGICCLG